jgi:sulfide dehydrogenase cytochrome subunit
MTKKPIAVLVGTVLSLGATQLVAGPSPSMLGHTCAGCHGFNGASTGPATPSIAGLSTAYMVDSMKAFASGDRKSTIMGRIAKGYTEEEFETMAEFFADQPVHKAKQTTDAAKVAQGKKLYKECEKCHEDNGASPDDDAGILAGQWLPYLNYSMADFKSGAREQPRKMKKKTEKLSDAEIEALMQFFASQQ